MRITLPATRRPHRHDARHRPARGRRGEDPQDAGRALREDEHEVTATRRRRRRCGCSGAPFDVLVVDNLMPELTGLDLVRELQASVPEAGAAADADDDGARAPSRAPIEAMKLGALDYLQKPFEVDELLVSGAPRARATAAPHAAALPARRARGGVRPLRHRRPQPGDAGRDRAGRARRASRSSTVLITGETGTGKELVARAIHDRSAAARASRSSRSTARPSRRRCSRPSCSATSGAPSPARSTHKKGRFELADGGTIFLDEIGDIAPACRPSCCACCRSASSSRSASERTLKVDVRVIAATNRDLRQMVARRPVPRGPLLPPQRDPDRACRRCASAARTSRCSSSTSSARIAARSASASTASTTAPSTAARRYDWPGNVRELENTIERAVVLATGPTIGRATSSAEPGAPAKARACRRRACTRTWSGPSASRSAALRAAGA